METLPPSPQMLAALADPDQPRQRKYDFPFKLLRPGETFTIPMDQVQIRVLRVIASREGKKNGVRYVVIQHKAHGLYEIGRALEKE